MVIGFIRSRQGHCIVGMGLRRAVSLAAIYAVALHIILFGIAPVPASGSGADDPFSIICHSDAQAVGAAEQAPAGPISSPATLATIAFSAARRRH